MRKLFIIITLALITMGCSSQDNSTTKADNNLCTINLNKLDNYKAQYGITTGEPENSQLKSLHEKAKQYQAAGDTKNCIAITEQALSIINSINTNN